MPATPYQSFAVLDDQELVGVVVYHTFRPPGIEIALACDDPRWALHRRLAFEVFAHPFVHLGCKRITAQIPDSNPRLQTLVEWLGFQREGTIRDGATDGDMGLYGLLRSDLRWEDSSRRERNINGTETAMS